MKQINQPVYHCLVRAMVRAYVYIPAQFVNGRFDSIYPDGRRVALCEPPLTGRSASRAWFGSVRYRLCGIRVRNVCGGKIAVHLMLTLNRRRTVQYNHPSVT